ncbi:MAG: hypothetical protein WDN29_15735 [Methylovirgula sp.]
MTRAFNEARRRGLVDAQTGRGTFVREGLMEAKLPGRADVPVLLDLSMNIPPQPSAARLQKRIPADIGALLSDPRGMLHLHYQESTGADADRIAGAAWLSRRMDARRAQSRPRCCRRTRRALCHLRMSLQIRRCDCRWSIDLSWPQGGGVAEGLDAAVCRDGRGRHHSSRIC